MIVLDTHVWIWFHIDSKKLSPQLLTEIEKPKTRLAISAISVWETIVAMQKGQVQISTSPESVVRSWLRESPFEVIPIEQEIALLSRTLQFEHEDPADRFIAATAYHLKAPVATADSRLLNLPWLQIII